MFKLYELSAALQQVNEMIEDGAEGLEDTLEALELSFEQKVEGIIKLKRVREAEAQAIDEEIKRLAARKSKLVKDADWLHSYVEQQMLAVGMGEVKSVLFKIKMAKTPPRVEVLNAAIIPHAYMRTTTTSVPDKVTIKDALKQGVNIPGVELRQDWRLQVK